MPPSDLPHDGRGGYLYHNSISVPNYAEVPINTSLFKLDQLLWENSSSAMTDSLLLGVCLLTLIHVFLFTTPAKRGRIVFNCVVAGLCFELLRQFCAIWGVTQGGTASTYYSLTASNPAANAYSNLSHGTEVAIAIDQLAALPGLVAVQVSYFILVRIMMSASRRVVVHLVTVPLGVLGFTAAILRSTQVTWSIVASFNAVVMYPPYWLQWINLVLYTISIGSWCLIYGSLTIRSVLSRIRLGIPFRRGEARYMMLMSALESMTIPVVFIILQWVWPEWILQAESCVIPSILVMLPFGTLWASSFDAAHGYRGHAGRYGPDHDNRGVLIQGSFAATNNSARAVFVDIQNASPASDSEAILPSLQGARAPCAAHPLDGLYDDVEKEEGICVRRQFAVTR